MTARGAIVAVVKPALQTVVPDMPVQDDINRSFDPPKDAPWARLTFQGGAESQAAIGGATRLVRRPLLLFVDCFAPSGTGDGLANRMADAARDAVRGLVVTGARFINFQEGKPEGVYDGDYQVQLIAVFRCDRRV